MEMLSKLEQLAKRRNKDLFKLEASKTNAQVDCFSSCSIRGRLTS